MNTSVRPSGDHCGHPFEAGYDAITRYSPSTARRTTSCWWCLMSAENASSSDGVLCGENDLADESCPSPTAAAAATAATTRPARAPTTRMRTLFLSLGAPPSTAATSDANHMTTFRTVAVA